MRFFTFITFIIFIASCGERDKKAPGESSGATYLQNAPGILKKIEPFFIKKNLIEYQCTDLDSFLASRGSEINISGLTQIDSSLCREIFGEYKNEYGDFYNSYFFSIDKPIHDFYPITVIQQFGVTETPLVLVLLDNNGKIVNDLEVADRYGESGGCLSSKFINDSTLIQHFEWNEVGVDTVSGKDIEETSYLTTPVIITYDGKLIKKEIKQ